MSITSIKKIISGVVMVALLVMGIAVPQRTQAGIIVAIVAVALFVDAVSCGFNVIWGCDDGGGGNGGGGGGGSQAVTLTAPEVVDIPDPVELTWSTDAAAVSCTASGDWSGSKGTSGTEKVIDPTGQDSLGTHTYSLKCVNGEGVEGSDSATVDVVAPSVTLKAVPPIVEIPDDVRLSWSSQNTVSCVASGEWSGNKALSGSEVVKQPTNTAFRGEHTYVMTCKNKPGYPASASATVTVIQVPRCTFTANPDTITPPQSSDLEWTCQYANSCSIDQGIGVVDPVSGIKTVRPTETTRYTLTCNGLDGTRAFPATVNIGGGGTRIHEENP